MKSLDERLSSIISPYDEVGMTQEELLEQQELQYQKDSVIESIGSRQFKIEYDLHFKEILEKLTDEEQILFVTKCVEKICNRFSMFALLDSFKRNETIKQEFNSILNFIEYFARDGWVEIGQFLPQITIDQINGHKNNLYIFQDLFTAHFSEIQNKIKTGITNQYMLWHFNTAAVEDVVNTIIYMLFLDLPGIVSVQLLYTK